ncbi:hypothetical protein RSAG8_13930, partial [Rhizoctonia solani AG-8 WAC10335]
MLSQARISIIEPGVSTQPSSISDIQRLAANSTSTDKSPIATVASDKF